MKNTVQEIAAISPALFRCSWGGWLAVSEDGASLRIGVVGRTEAEARHAFEVELAEWVKLREEREAGPVGR